MRLQALNASEQAKNFNLKFPVGTQVAVVRDNGSILLTTVRAEADIIGNGESAVPVVWLHGISGCYDISKVYPYEYEPLMQDSERIVGEISKNWLDVSVQLKNNLDTQIMSNFIARQFESVILHNKTRGYMLEAWQYKSLLTNFEGIDGIQETIIAVFKKLESK